MRISFITCSPTKPNRIFTSWYYVRGKHKRHLSLVDLDGAPVARGRIRAVQGITLDETSAITHAIDDVGVPQCIHSTVIPLHG